MRHYLFATTAALVSAATVNAAAAQYFPEVSKDFGTTPRGPVLTHYFPVKNTSSETVYLGSPRVSCGCVSASALKYTLAPGESTAIVANMDSRRIPVSGVTRTVTVFVPVQTGNVSEEMQLRVTAIARDDLVLTNDTFAFGTVRKGQGGKATTKITFYSDPNWQITDAQSTGIYIKPEVKAVPKGSPAESTAYEVTATLDPACPVGNWTADVWLKSTAAGIPNLRVPVTVTVVPPVDVKADFAPFTSATVGKPTEQKVVLQAMQPFKILEIKGEKDGVTATGISPMARPVHILTVTAKPTKEGDFGTVLEVVTDHPDMPKVMIPVAGKATKGE